MPQSSRKRNKGKERKAKKARADAHRFWHQYFVDSISHPQCNRSIGCNHGHDIVISDDHPVSSFMDTFCINFEQKDMIVNRI